MLADDAGSLSVATAPALELDLFFKPRRSGPCIHADMPRSSVINAVGVVHSIYVDADKKIRPPLLHDVIDQIRWTDVACY